MSRLTPKDIENIPDNLTKNEIREIAAYAVDFTSVIPPVRCAVIPVTSGLGIIGNFCESVRAILNYCGADAFITEKRDVAGIREAYDKRADLFFAADDDVCALFGTRSNVCSDNAYATGIGFAAALEKMNGGAGEAIILGAGAVGLSAARYLANKKWSVSVYDPIREKIDFAVRTIPDITAEYGLESVKKYRNILCAANSGGFITADYVTKNTNISAPGMPLGVTEEAAAIANVFHNPLELGVSVMFYDCLSQLQQFRMKCGIAVTARTRCPPPAAATV